MEKELNLKEEGRPIRTLESIEEDLKRVYDHFRSVNNRNKYLEKEIERVKSEKYKDEELTKMKEQYDRMLEDYYRGFPISKVENQKIAEWKDNLPKANVGAIGGRFRYEFVPTSIGVVGTIIDSFTGEKLTFQDL